ncbi:MAG: C4-type zinc ribbon domain-containing protein, partial [bacterium]
QDKMLIDLEAIEAQEQQTLAQKKEYETQSLQWAKQAAEIERKNDTLATQLEEAQKQQDAYESQLKGAYYQAYVNLRKCGKAMPRVVPVKDDGKCGGCFLALSRETMDRLQKEGVQFCEHCGRILYKAEDL